MFKLGKMLSTGIKIVTLPVDAASVGFDVLSGGDGSKRKRLDNPVFGDIEKLRDNIAKAARDVDRDDED